METVEGEKVIQLPDGPAAFSWAEEILARPPIESQFAKMGKIRGAGEMTLDEMRDQALTIVSVVSRVQPAHLSLTFRFVYGREDATVVQNLVDQLVRLAFDTVPKSKGKHQTRVVRVAYETLESFRKYRLFNKRQTYSKTASSIGVSRQSFYDAGWPDLVLAIRGALEQWINTGDKWITDELRDKGFVA